MPMKEITRLRAILLSRLANELAEEEQILGTVMYIKALCGVRNLTKARKILDIFLW